MRPKESGESCAGNQPGPGYPPANNPALPPTASPAPEPSTKPKLVSKQAPAAGQGAGSQSSTRSPSGSPSVSGPPAGAQGASASSAVRGKAQSVPSNSNKPRTRLFPGPSGPRATDLGTGKVMDISKTPAASIRGRQRMSDSERVTFIREVEEALSSDQTLSVKKITQDDVKMMLNLLDEREQDLNTATLLSQSLTKQNSVLEENNSKLVAMLDSAREEILQLRHQMSLQDGLLQLYSDSDDEKDDKEEEVKKEEEVEEKEKKKEEKEQQHDHPNKGPELTPLTSESLHRPQLEALQKQLRLLEKENEQLREKASQLDVLEQDQMFILGYVEQFFEASLQMSQLSEVLVNRMENLDEKERETFEMWIYIKNLQEYCELYGTENQSLKHRLSLEEGIHSYLQKQLDELQRKRREGEGTPKENKRDVRTSPQQAPAPESVDNVTHYTYTVPMELFPDFQEAMAVELRKSVKKMVSDPACFTERCEQHSSEESEEGSMPAEDFMSAEELVPGERLVPGEGLVPDEGLVPAEEVVSAEESVTEEVELVSEDTEAWEEVEPEPDEAAQSLEASDLGPSGLDMKYVLQQLANWQDSHYGQQTPQNGVVSQQPAEAPHKA
ncbi:huntingtin-associated protein 1 [Saccopteryx bilineata]|uniref:huntingtin-associated protein 1 n=1 Tax=Saccopteryx bilineata TaxID=59482 RepID=UPI00338FA2B8